MGREKIKHETKREKRDFRLGGTQEEGERRYCRFQENSQGGESKVLPHLTKIICVCENKEK